MLDYPNVAHSNNNPACKLGTSLVQESSRRVAKKTWHMHKHCILGHSHFFSLYDGLGVGIGNDAQPLLCYAMPALLLWSGLIPRPSPAPVFDCLQYAKTEPEGPVNLTTWFAARLMSQILDRVSSGGGGEGGLWLWPAPPPPLDMLRILFYM